MTDIRRIQRTGGSTYIVSLPKKWIVDNDLKQGDRLMLEINDSGTICIDPDIDRGTKKNIRELEVTPETMSSYLLRQLIGIYVSGFDVIEIHSKGRMPAEVKRTIQEFSRRVIGPEIIEESSTHVVLQDVADHSDLAMKKVVRRMHLMARNMLEESVRAVASQDRELALEVVTRDDEVDRLYWFVEKQHAMMGRNPSFARKLNSNWLEAHNMLLTAKALERIADHATRISNSVALIGPSRIESEILTVFESTGSDAVSLLDSSMEAFFRRDSEAANSCIDKAANMAERTGGYLGTIMKRRGKASIWLAFIFESLERTGGYSADIAEIAINLAEGS